MSFNSPSFGASKKRIEQAVRPTDTQVKNTIQELAQTDPDLFQSYDDTEIKQQIAQQSEEIANIKYDVFMDDTEEEIEEFDLTVGVLDGCYSQKSNKISYTGLGKYWHHVFDVSEGEKYHINAQAPADTIALVVFTDGESVVGFIPSELSTVRINDYFTVPSGATKMYINHNGITDNTNSYYFWYLERVTTKKVSVKKYVENETQDLNPLRGKKIVCIGDSIMKGQGYNGDTHGEKSFVNMIAEKNSMECVNYAVSGATLCSGTNESVFHICDNIESMDEDADYIVFDGGYNDHTYRTPLGTITDDYTTELTTAQTRTIVGGAEKACRELLNRYPTKKILYVFTHKIKDTPYTEVEDFNHNGGKHTMTDVHDAIKEVMKKYSIPYVDLFEESQLNTALPQYLQYTANQDGTHPTKLGYELFYCDKVERKLRSL